MTKTVEINVGATNYSVGDNGTGTGTLNTLTDNAKSWINDYWNSNYLLIDSAGTSFSITDTTLHAVIVSGTPATGAYVIVPKHSGFFSLNPTSYRTPAPECVTVLLDADSVEIDWTNMLLSIQRPVSKTSQTTPYNASAAYTYSPLTFKITLGAEAL